MEANRSFGVAADRPPPRMPHPAKWWHASGKWVRGIDYTAIKKKGLYHIPNKVSFYR